jgi:hypothetical protein
VRRSHARMVLAIALSPMPSAFKRLALGRLIGAPSERPGEGTAEPHRGALVRVDSAG